MASATLRELPQQDGQPLSLAKRVMPWLLSTASHLSLMLVMAVLYEKQHSTRDTALPGHGVLLIRAQAGSADGGGGNSVDAADYYQDEESQGIDSAQSANPSVDDGLGNITVHAQGELASLWDEPPPVILQELAAASAAGPSPATSQATLPARGNVPNALAMIRSGSRHPGGGRGQAANSGVGDGAGPVGLGKTLEKGAARTGIFGVSGVGYKFVYVFDRSGSMDGHGGTPLAAAKAELIRSLRALDQKHQFQIIFYNEHPRVFTPAGNDGRLVFGTEQNLRLAERFVGGITADGATQHEDAIALALRLNPDVIFFLTDADEPTMSARQLARIARLNNGTNINAIEFGYGPRAGSDNFLVQLARQNGGQHAYVDISELPRP